LNNYRIEEDSIGKREVPIDAYYGVQSLRASENFKITGKKVHPEFIKGIVEVKMAAAIANFKVGVIDKNVSLCYIIQCRNI
jgi:aspartate ammonia-lyase